MNQYAGHRYYDVSHYRAPYLDWPLSGFGALDPASAALVDVGAGGVAALKPAVAQAIVQMLLNFDTGSALIAPGVPNAPNVSLVPALVPGNGNAPGWIANALMQGQSVVAWAPGGPAAFAAPTTFTSAARLLYAVPPSQEVQLAGTPSDGNGAVLLRPAAGASIAKPAMFSTASMTPGKVAVAVLAAAGVYYVWKKAGRSKRATA